MSSTLPDADEALAAIGHRIHRSLGSLEKEAKIHEDENSFFPALVNESQRFGLWANNLGLYNLGHSSLDYIFRDAPMVYQYTRHLLVSLEDSVSKIQQDLRRRKTEQEIVVVQPRTPGRLSDQAVKVDKDYDVYPASDESSEDEEALMSYSAESISTIALENAKLIIDRLYKLSFKIRNPATRLGFSKARSYCAIDKETGVDLMKGYAYFDLRHVTEIMARYWRVSPEECENRDLVRRLARANTNRRRQFGQWRRRRLKLESVEKAFTQRMENNSNVTAVPGLLKVPRAIRKSVPSLPYTATRLDENIVNLNDTDSAVSSSSYAIDFAGNYEDNVIIQPLPERFCTGEEFECPFCHILCSKRICNKTAWERHVYKDLRPYVCTYEECAEGDQQYDNFRDWVGHEINTHLGSGMRLPSPSEQSSEDRVLSLGSSKSPSQPQSSKLMAPNDTCRQQCPICLEKNPTFEHVGLHLRRFAVFSLPNLSELDEDKILGDQGSNIANIDDRTSMSSQSTFERLDKDILHKDEKDGDPNERNPRSTRDVVPIRKTTQEDVLDFRHALDQMEKCDGKGLDMNSFLTGLELDDTYLYQGKSNNTWPDPVNRQPGRGDHKSFYARIDSLRPNYQAQQPQYGPHKFWRPPTIRTGYTIEDSRWFRWKDGAMTAVESQDPVVHSLHQTYDAATVFTQNPDTPHLLVVPFDARTRHVYQYPGGWRPLCFRHLYIGNSQRTYSAVVANGDRQHIATPGSHCWMPQLLPRVYDHQNGSRRIQAGLVGSLPLLLALAAFSAPPAFLRGVLTKCLIPGAWRPHQYQYPAGHIAERGMVVTTFFDPQNPRGSNPVILSRLEKGEFGPFYS